MTEVVDGSGARVVVVGADVDVVCDDSVDCVTLFFDGGGGDRCG